MRGLLKVSGSILVVAAAAAAVSLPAARALAGEAKAEEVKAGDPIVVPGAGGAAPGAATKPGDAAPGHVTIHAKDATQEKLLEQFTKATGLTFNQQQENMGGRERGPTPIVLYDFDAENQMQDVALDRLAKMFDRQFRFENNDARTVQVTPYNPPGLYNENGQQESPSEGGAGEGPRLVPSQVSRQSTLPPETRNGNGPTITVYFNCVGGSRQTVFGQPQVQIDECVDDAGHTLSAPNQQRGRSTDVHTLGQNNGNQAVTLAYAGAAPKQLKKLKGSMNWEAPSTMTRITFSGLKDGKDVTAQTDDADIVLKAPTGKDGGYEVKLTIQKRGAIAAPEWQLKSQAMLAAFNQAKIYSADKKPMNSRGASWGGTEITRQYGPPSNRNGSPDNAAVTDTIVWEFVKDTTSFKLPFDATDIPLP